MMSVFRRRAGVPALWAAIGAMLLLALPQHAQARLPHSGLQCVAYARAHSAIALHGNARTWWGQAEGLYARGDRPQRGAVLAFRGTRAMRAGHVAVVAKVLDSRHVLLDHANWSTRGGIDRGALAVDVSDAGDWSAVRVWHKTSGTLGLRVNPAFGFIYAGRAPTGDDQQLARSDDDDAPQGG